jgi:hypothetical protein
MYLKGTVFILHKTKSDFKKLCLGVYPKEFFQKPLCFKHLVSFDGPWLNVVSDDE